jgi:hypothetical protein
MQHSVFGGMAKSVSVLAQSPARHRREHGRSVAFPEVCQPLIFGTEARMPFDLGTQNVGRRLAGLSFQELNS